MSAHREEATGAPIPTCITKCCREWISPFGFRGGRCGYCNEAPTFVRMLPESEWVTPRPPIRLDLAREAKS